MTNSTDKTKKTKKKGPLRFEAILPIVAISALLGLYFSYLFDSNLKSFIEFTGGYINGAEVNVGSVRSSFLKASFQMNNLQVTDKKQPERNSIQIEKIRFQFLWDALLRAKFVTQEARVENIQVDAPRKKAGWVTPPSKSAAAPLKKLEDNVLKQTQSEFDQNLLGDLAHIVDGADPKQQLKNIKGQLKSDIFIKGLNASLKEKELAWKKRINDLPNKKEFETLLARAKKLKFNSKNPLQLGRDIQELDKILKEGDKKIKAFKASSKNLKGDLNSFNQSFKGLEQIAQQDIKDLQQRLKIPNLDIKDFSMKLFGRMFAEKVAMIRKYSAVAREYMPEKKSDKESEESTELIPQERQNGKTYKFPITVSYPLFWLRYAKVSSKPSSSEFSGKLSGEIIDITNNPKALGKPAKINLEGDFPHQKIYGVKLNIVLDHTTQIAKETFTGMVSRYPLPKQVISDSSDVQFFINKASGRADFKGSLQNQQLKVFIDNKFSKVDYKIKAKSKVVDDILKGVAADIPVISIQSRATGSWNKISWHIRSNLGRKLSEGFKAQVQKKIKEAKDQLKSYVNQRISSERQKLDKKFKGVQSQIDDVLRKKKKELESAKSKVKKDMNKRKKDANKSQQKKLKEKGKKLLKSLGL